MSSSPTTYFVKRHMTMYRFWYNDEPYEVDFQRLSHWKIVKDESSNKFEFTWVEDHTFNQQQPRLRRTITFTTPDKLETFYERLDAAYATYRQRDNLNLYGSNGAHSLFGGSSSLFGNGAATAAVGAGGGARLFGGHSTATGGGVGNGGGLFCAPVTTPGGGGGGGSFDNANPTASLFGVDGMGDVIP